MTDTSDFQGTADPGIEDAGQSGEVESGLSGFARDYLGKVPEEHRPIVQQHLQEWDKNFTKYSQQVQGKLKAYEGLGADPETLQNSLQLYNTMLHRPEDVYEALVNAGYGPKQAQAMTNQVMEEQEQGQGQQENSVPPHLQQQFQKYEQALNTIARHLQQQEEAKRQESELREFDTLMNNLEKKYQGMDRDLVTRMIATGMEPEQAAQRYMQMVQGVVNENARPKPPTVLGSGSAVPRPNKPMSELDGKERKEFLAEALKGMANNA